MDRSGDFRIVPSVLADLGPLPEVTESSTETTWKLFETLQSDQMQYFPKTEPSALMHLGGSDCAEQAALTVHDAMVEARRSNRVCPKEPHWQDLCDVLRRATRTELPTTLVHTGAPGTPPLAKRMVVRDLVEWAAQHGQVALVLGFFRALPEDRWMHMGR